LEVDLLAIVSAPILKEAVFEPARLGCLNAHPGWLPKYRGLGANAYALANGDSPGISIHFIDAGVDTGRIIMREKIDIQSGDTVAKINDRAVARGAVLMARVIHQIRNNSLVLPEINEDVGKNYRSMPYAQVKKINAQLKSIGGKHGI
jgi:methionyl-tRNA formyltransferase